MMGLADTPRGNRLHIGIFGKRNAGKSSLINALTGQQTALVSEVAGTTTDPVYKSMEIHGIGPCVLIDTAGFDDTGELGRKRIEKTEEAAAKTDIALVIFSGDDFSEEMSWVSRLRAQKTPVIPVVGKKDLKSEKELEQYCAEVEKTCEEKPLVVSTFSGEGIGEIRERILRSLPEDYDQKSLTGDMVSAGDLVLLVMPQDIQAPKGRLILPQVQTIRELLDKKCLVMSCVTDRLEETLKALSRAPKLIITDSQVFGEVYEKKPPESRLTSFSVLMAGSKGDISYFAESAAAIERLREDSRVLIAEACTHAPLKEDIGREKLPRLLRKKAGQGLQVDIVAGVDFPQDLTPYDLVIHCGACMFNRKHVLSRVERARSQGVPMTNYGVALAALSGILTKIDLPK